MPREQLTALRGTIAAAATAAVLNASVPPAPAEENPALEPVFTWSMPARFRVAPAAGRA